MPTTHAHRLLRAALALALAVLNPAAAAQPAGGGPVKLRIVGGLSNLSQSNQHEEPFWTQRLSQLSGGRYSAEIVPFDRAGIRGQEMLSLIQLGAVPFGTVIVTLGSTKEMMLSAPDLAGLNPDIASLRRSVAAFRPTLQALLRERYGIELLGVYTYPAQVVFCSRPLAGLDGLKGRRVRTSSATQSDWVEALGGTPVVTPFASLMTSLAGGSLDCAITGTMSGNTIGLQDVTTHLHPMAVNWGLSILAANGAAWAALPPDLQALLRRELPRLEESIWQGADAETSMGVACNTGDPSCKGGRPGRMVRVAPSPQDEVRRRELFAKDVLPRWLQRCGPTCVDLWNRSLAPVAGVEARPF